MTANYVKNCRCKTCGALKDHAPHGASFENSFESRRFCHNCGSSEGWFDSVEIWVSESVWFKPFTWFTGFWMKKGADFDPTANGKPCPKCTAAMASISSQFVRMCTSCDHVEEWKLNDGQAPLITASRDRGLQS